jgi:DNA-binding response OmpR family regulator/HPt (histidine-containing phosphotransfer) domain-containing protein
MKILLVEDDPTTSEFLSTTLCNHRYTVDAIADGAAGLELALQWSYDLILLDIMIPNLNGIEVCRRLRQQSCQTPILILTMKDSNEDVIAGLDAGADDYVAKSCDSAQLLARVRALVRRGRSASSSPVLTWEHLCLDPALARVTYKQQSIALRPKEYSLLELFLRHPQRIFSRSAIIDHLWSMEETPVEGSITNLIKDLRQRLKSAGMSADLIETVYGVGYRLRACPTEQQRAKAQGSSRIGQRVEGIDPIPLVGKGWDSGREIYQQSGFVAIQQITERFRVSLEQRIVTLEAAVRSLQTGDFSVQQQQAAKGEAHKLAGGLGTFGCVRASEVAQAIEHLLEDYSQTPPSANQLARLLNKLKHELAETVSADCYSDSRI